MSIWRPGSGQRTSCLVVWFVISTAAIAQIPGSPGSFLPAPGATFVGSGLQLSSPQARFDQGEGYTPICFTLQPVSPPAVDRELTIDVRLSVGRRSDSSLRVTKALTVPAGATGPIEATVLWPPSSWNGPLWFEIYEGGQPIAGLTGNINSNMMGWFPGGAPPCLAIVNGAALGGTVQSEITRRWQGLWQSGGRVATPIAVAPTFLGPSFTDLPEQWLEYSNVDLLCVTLADANSLAEQNPSRWRAIRDWTLAGGNLLISGLDGQWAGLADVDRLLGDRSSGMPWTEMILAAEPDSSEPDPAPPNSKTAALIKAAFKAPRPLGMGQVLVTKLSSVGDIRTEHWKKIRTQIGHDRLHWSARHGLTLQARNDDFYEFLVPGVGSAPVTEFTVLITLFAVLVGPVNFYVLRQRNRLYLLMISVPVAALLATAGLLAYAALGEGLGVRVRARSVMQLDQRTGDAVTWARLSYYAGVGPSEGLRFPSDMAVLPIYPFRREETDARRALHWSEDQHLASGWLPARSPAQFLTIRPRQTSARLNVVVADGQPVRVENALGAAVTHLVVFDDRGKPHVADDVAAGTSAALAANGDLTAIGRALFEGQSSKQLPEGLTDLRSNRGLFEVNNRRDWYYYSFPPGRMGSLAGIGDASRLERVLATLGGSKTAIANSQNHEPRTYIAIVDRSPELVFGLDSVQAEASFHVIVGKW